MARIVMMLFLISLGACKSGSQETKDSKSGEDAAVSADSLPQLHVIKPYTFEVPFSCNPGGTSDMAKSALFLTTDARTAGRASVVLHGVCEAAPYFQAATEGADFGLIANLGDVPLETVSAARAFNYEKVAAKDNTFKKIANFAPNQTFVVMVSRTTGRELIVFKVRSAEAAGPSFKNVRVEYIVRDYRAFTEIGASPGFDWAKEQF